MLDAASAHRPFPDPDAALLSSARSGDADFVALALRDGADLETVYAAGRSALVLPSGGDHVEAPRVLVALGADRW